MNETDKETPESMKNLKHSMTGVPQTIRSDKDISDFLSIGLNNIIESVCTLYEESDEGSDEELNDEELESDQENYVKEDEDDEDYFEEVNNNKDVLVKVINFWISSKEEIINEQEEENDKLIEENNNLNDYIDKLLLYIDDINREQTYMPPKNTICKDGSLDMRVRENKGQQKFPYGQQIMGNSHNSYISHPRCKLCRMSICGRCVKHGG